MEITGTSLSPKYHRNMPKCIKQMLCIGMLPLTIGCTEQKPDIQPPASQVGWMSNVKVIAATGQDSKTLFVPYSPIFDNFSSSYLNSLFNELEQPKCQSIEEASETLIKNGYKLFPFWPLKTFPTETPRKLGMFNKNDKENTKIVLLINGDDPKDKNNIQLFKEDCQVAREKLRTIYNLPERNLYSLSIPDIAGGYTKAKGDSAFKDIVTKIINDLTQNKTPLQNVEFLIIYSGHGLIENKTSQGAFEGSKSMRINIGYEKDLKKFINNNSALKKLKGILFLNDTCGSGALIATKTNFKKLLNFIA